jgi:hypothetical protein
MRGIEKELHAHTTVIPSQLYGTLLMSIQRYSSGKDDDDNPQSPPEDSTTLIMNMDRS